MRLWIDVSNYSQPFTPAQLDFLKQNNYGVTIGLQDADKARAFKAQCAAASLPHDYYVDLPGRDFTIPEHGAEVYIDIEPGCFVAEADVDQAIYALKLPGLKPAIYGNKTSIAPLIGNSAKWASLPLWYGNWPNDHHIPDISEFVPFAGWEKPEGWQYSTLGIAGINCDLSILFEPPKPPHLVRFESMYYLDDGSKWPVTGSFDPPP